MAARFTIPKDTAFEVTLPVDVSNPDAPRLIVVDSLEKYIPALKAVPQGHLEFYHCTFRQPDWGLDCYVREQAYTGGSVNERSFSSEKQEEARLRYYLVGTTLIDDKFSFQNDGRYPLLSGVTEAAVRLIQPFALRLFFLVAGKVWDLGVPVKELLTQEDFLTLRNDPDAANTILLRKGLKPQGITDPNDPEAKKNQQREPEKVSSPSGSQGPIVGMPSSSLLPGTSGPSLA